MKEEVPATIDTVGQLLSQLMPYDAATNITINREPATLVYILDASGGRLDFRTLTCNDDCRHKP